MTTSLKFTMMMYTTFWTVADTTQQKFICRKEKIDFKKTARMTTVGTFVIAPMVFYWMLFVERLFPGNAAKTVLKKVGITQFLYAPGSISTFYFTTCVLEGKNREQIFEEWKEKFIKTYSTSMTVWPFVHLVNFRFVPPPHRPKLIGTTSFLWSMFLCFLKENRKKREAKISRKPS